MAYSFSHPCARVSFVKLDNFVFFSVPGICIKMNIRDWSKSSRSRVTERDLHTHIIIDCCCFNFCFTFVSSANVFDFSLKIDFMKNIVIIGAVLEFCGFSPHHSTGNNDITNHSLEVKLNQKLNKKEEKQKKEKNNKCSKYHFSN